MKGPKRRSMIRVAGFWCPVSKINNCV